MSETISNNVINAIKNVRDTDSFLISKNRYTYNVSALELYNFIIDDVSKTSGKPKFSYYKPLYDNMLKTIKIECISKIPVNYKLYFNGILISQNNTGLFNIDESQKYFGNYFVIAENENGYVISEVLQINS